MPFPEADAFNFYSLTGKQATSLFEYNANSTFIFAS
jgi:hypothetical protein